MNQLKTSPLAILVSLLIFIPMVAGAQSGKENQTVDLSFLKGLKYRSIGPYRGGRVTAVEGVASKPNTFYMGPTGGGVWKTTDAGESWQNISDEYFKAGSIGSIAVADSDPNVIYVGTGSDAPRGNISPGIGMYKSTDAGKTWHHTGLSKGGQIGDVAIHPQNPNLVYAAVLGNIFGPNPERGVYRSEDGGKSWESVMSVSDSTGAVAIDMDPNNPRILYAGFWRAERKPWAIIDGSTEGGVYKSVDGGDSWNRVKGGLPNKGLLGKVEIAVSPANSDRIWVMQQAKKEEAGGLYRSDDGGESWKRVNGEHELRQRQWYYTHLYSDPKDENTVYVLNTGFYKSTDAGKTFENIAVPHGDVQDLWLNPDDPNIMINSNDGGANVTLNGGKTWSTQLNQPTAEFYRVEVDNQFPYRVYGAQQDNSTITVPSKSPGDVTPKQYWYSIGGGESGHIAVHPKNPNIVYSGSYSGEITRYDHATGKTTQFTAYPHYTEGTNMTELKYRFQWNFPIVISEHNPDNIYITSQFVHKSTDGGFNWETISPDLTTDDPKFLDRIPGGPIMHDATGVEVYSSIFAFAESPHQEGELWAGSDDGRIHISRNDGGNWKDITPGDMPEAGTVNSIDISPHNPGTAYVGVYKYRRADFTPYIFKTDDYGDSWEQLATDDNGIPDDQFVRVVREDPNREGLLYAGTEFGIFISFDDGGHWQPFQLNLPHTPVTDITIKGKDLVLSTQGRSFWILDDLSPLYELNEENMKADFDLFKPRIAYRTQLNGDGQKPGPEAYPSGALIYFYLRDIPKNEPVTLEIRDARDNPVRTFSSDSTKKEDVEKFEIEQGLNRFEWDLNYRGPFTVKNLVTMVLGHPARGPEAVPGTYKVRIQAGEWDDTKSFELKADPRWDTTTEDLQETFELASGISEMINTFQRAIAQIRSVRKQINILTTAGTFKEDKPGIQEMADSLNKKLTDFEENLINNKMKSGQDPIGMERRLSNRMGRLYQVVRGHDEKPTGGMLERFDDLKKLYDGLMNEYETLMDEDLKSFNESLESEDIEHIVITPAD